ncbi:uncharacterized protein EAE98_005767 [Botrytis deweyae]|uniref:Class II aldolase/adducin N-terminal domain-containing protein n=1 Tax=Botrytis deweyae TaxID=2478750 RepID=A0ABQ7IMQ6_9HELO|nr:uncharacterized protein EAE98_005767 [Botrytis deweyae]KAF7928711.1 hypothetical protein EAE98_005767 [Botrytis deweyae]
MSPTATSLDNEPANNSRVGAKGTTVSGKKLKIRSYPRFESLEEERLYRKQHLAAAFRIFADRGFDEGVAGHISVRDPILTDHFWLNPLSQHFSQICVSDLILVDEAAFWFISLDKTCHAQLLVDAAASGSGKVKKIIGDEEAAFTYDQVGGPEKGWLAFQGYYDEIMAKTGGNFLK